MSVLHKFAHISDIHLGAFPDPTIRKLEKQCLEEAANKCIDFGVDFVLISGDIFHVGIPDLSIVNDSIRIFRKLVEAHIPIYVIYGSHDYTPNGTSIIDILETAGILTNVMKPRIDDEGYFVLDFFKDPKTGVKLTGISARRVGLESKFYEKLDKKRLEYEKGFKIFAFHSGISEFKPAFLSEMETVPISNFPKGFNYYAGGHIHKRDIFELPSYPNIVFPGPLFSGYGKDIEETAKGVKRGFYVVTFDDKVNNMEFVPIEIFDGEFLEYDATGKNSHQAMKDVAKNLDDIEVNGKILIVRLKGELSGGKTSDIDIMELRRKLASRGALYVQFNRFSLTTKEYSGNKVSGEDVPTMEANLFRENIGTVAVKESSLKGKVGVDIAIELLRNVRQSQKIGETKMDYETRILGSALRTLKLDREFRSE